MMHTLGVPDFQEAGKRPASRSIFYCMGMLLVLLSGCALQNHHETAQVLGDVTAGSGDSALKRKTALPSRMAVSYAVDDRRSAGDLYLPADRRAEAGIVLVPGAVEEGKDQENLVQLAYTLARKRFAVLIPDLVGFRKLKVGPSDIRAVADAFRFLAASEELPAGAGIGIAAFSYAVGPAVLAALEDDIREQVQFIFAIGGYYDMSKSIRFITTGYYELEGKLATLPANEYGKLVFARSVLDHLSDPADREIIDAMVDMKLKDPNASLSALARGLGTEGRAVYSLLMNPDPARTFDLIANLPAGARRMVTALSLHDKDLSRLRARLILVHARNDPLLPFSESVALAGAVAPSQAKLFILKHILGHVNVSPSNVLSWRFWTRELPDALRLFQATGLLLQQREGA